MRVYMCADYRISSGNLGILHYPCKRGRHILEEVSDRNFDALCRYKVDYVGNRASRDCT